MAEQLPNCAGSGPIVMGGRLVLQTARVEDDLGAAVAFYGSALTPEEAAEVKAPILGIYGSEGCRRWCGLWH
ncbi:MAG: dienelactone hydrolase family protein [Anaerolineae bacterium]